MAEGAPGCLSTQQIIARIEATKPLFNNALVKVKTLSNALDGKSSSLRVEKVHTALRQADDTVESIIADTQEILARRHWDPDTVLPEDVLVTRET